MENLFEIATREKYRFPANGELTVEHLWGVKLETLDTVYKNLYKQRSELSEVSLLDSNNSKVTKETIDRKINIVRYIFDTKKAEQEENKAKELRRKRAEEIKELIAEKSMDADRNKSVGELRKEYEELTRD